MEKILGYLPAIYQKSPEVLGVNLQQILLPFEGILLNEYNLILISDLTSEGLPDKGYNLMIIAKDRQDLLYIRIFDAQGKMAIDLHESSLLKDKKERVKKLKGFLKNYWNNDISLKIQRRIIYDVRVIANYNQKSLEDIIANSYDVFDPERTPVDCLQWLADWVSLSLRADLSEDRQRKFLGDILQLYQYRGTKRNLKKLLKIFTDYEAIIQEGDEPHTFTVKVVSPEDITLAELARQRDIVSAIIDIEKPAHTKYELEPLFPGMRVGVDSIVGEARIGTVRS